MTEGLVPFHEVGLWWVPLILIAMIVAVMVAPMSRFVPYWWYRRPLYVFGTLAEMFIFVPGAFMVLAPAGPVRFYGFFGSILVFWVLTIILANPRVIGRFVPEISSFRPDLMYPSGAALARGEIFAGLSMKVLLSGVVITGFGLSPMQGPMWSWWGLAWAFYAMIFLIPVRSMVKMKLRMAALFAGRKRSYVSLLVEELLLWGGFSMLAYGFLSVFMGNIPFQYVTPAYPTVRTLYLPALFPLGVSFVVLVPLRAWYKSLHDPMTETFRITVGGQGILYTGVLILLYGWIAFYMGGFLLPKNTLGLWIFAVVQPLAALLIVYGRAKALRHERAGMLANVLHFLSNRSSEVQRRAITDRLRAISRLPESRRIDALAAMNASLNELPEEEQERLNLSRMGALATVEPAVRERIMAVMDRALASSDPGGVARGKISGIARRDGPETSSAGPRIPNYLRIPMLVNIGMGGFLVAVGVSSGSQGLITLGVAGGLLFLLLLAMGAA